MVAFHPRCHLNADRPHYVATAASIRRWTKLAMVRERQMTVEGVLA
jgi:hypothetical protein